MYHSSFAYVTKSGPCAAQRAREKALTTREPNYYDNCLILSTGMSPKLLLTFRLPLKPRYMYIHAQLPSPDAAIIISNSTPTRNPLLQHRCIGITNQHETPPWSQGLYEIHARCEHMFGRRAAHGVTSGPHRWHMSLISPRNLAEQSSATYTMPPAISSTQRRSETLTSISLSTMSSHEGQHNC